MKPTYNMRSQSRGQSLVFIYHLAFGGKTYKGEEAGNKKLAEHLATRTAIKSLLGNLEGESSRGQKRNANTNNDGRNKKRRFGN
ncbi:hypothetical protein KY289_017285 [Solanum tuberosum]|nr:hypothetical protein KY289_017285 [Solanum tuberosum]